MRPRPLRVHVIGRQRRDPAPVVHAGGEQPGQLVRDRTGSAAPGYASSDRARSGPPRWSPGTPPGPRPAPDRIAVSGLARKFCTITSWIAPYCRAIRRIANSDSARSAIVSPIPTRMPVVNGIVLRPASSSTRSRTAGSLSGDPKCAPAGFGEDRGRGGLQHHPHRRRDRLEPLHLLPAHHAGVQVRQQTRSPPAPGWPSPAVGQRAVVPVAVQPLPSLRPAVLGPVAEGEQRLLAPEGGALPGDLQDLVRGQVRGRQPAGHGDESAVMATVPAQPGQRDEHLAGVGDHPGPAGGRESRVPHPGGAGTQIDQVRAGGLQQHTGFGHIQRHSVTSATQGPAHRRGRGCFDRAVRHGAPRAGFGRRSRLPSWTCPPSRGHGPRVGVAQWRAATGCSSPVCF